MNARPAAARIRMTASGSAVRATRLPKKPMSTKQLSGIALGRSIWTMELRKLSRPR